MAGSYYVKRSTADGNTGWTGPIRSEVQAGKEAVAWASVGRTTEVLPSTPEVKAEIRAWIKAKNRR